MDKRQRKKLTKILLNLLAKNPAEFLLIGSSDGWIKIADIHKALLEEKLMPFLTPKVLEQFFCLYRPKEFEIHQENHTVRARPDLIREDLFQYRPKNPPPFLFVPIRPKAYFAVEKGGIGPPHGKEWLLLCASRQRATILGKRFHPAPLIIKVLSEAAHLSGHPFHYAGSELYLTKEWLQPQWLQLPPAPSLKEESTDNQQATKDKEARDKSEKLNEEYEEKPFLPGSFIPSFAYFEEYAKEKGKRAQRRSRKLKARRNKKR